MTATDDALRTDLVDDLRGQVSGRVVDRRDPAWADERRGWNLAVDTEPGAVVHVDGVPDIVAAVRFAGTHGLAVTAQPVGHGATRAIDGAIVLRTGSLRELTVDVAGRVARVGAGVRWQQLNEALTGTGLTSLPGSSGDPSVVGYTLGGGMSWFGRRYGVAAHRVRAVELVDARGEQVRVTEASDPDLFWALRGGGGDFGIVTAIELDLLPLEQLYGGRLVWPVEHAAEVLTAFSELCADAPEELTLWAWLLNLPDAEPVPGPMRGRWTVAIDATYLGSAAGAETLLAPLRGLPGPLLDTLAELPLAGLDGIAAEPAEPTPVLDHAALLRRFDADAVAMLLDAVAPDRPSALTVAQVRRLGGALSRPAPGQGAGGTVDQPYLLLAGAVVPDPGLAGPAAAAVDRVRLGLVGIDSGWAPLNFGRHAALVYPPAVLERLRRTKSRVDPGQVIRGNRPVHDAGPA